MVNLQEHSTNQNNQTDPVCICEPCRKQNNEPFRKIAEVKNSGLNVYQHEPEKADKLDISNAVFVNPEPMQRRQSAMDKTMYPEHEKNQCMVLENKTRRDLERYEVVNNLCQYMGKCIKCKTLVSWVQNLLDDVTTNKQSEIVGVCEYCKKYNKRGNCTRCETLVGKFLKNRLDMQRMQIGFVAKLTDNVLRFLKSISDHYQMCNHIREKCILKSHELQELHKYLPQLYVCVCQSREIEIKTFPDSCSKAEFCPFIHEENENNVKHPFDIVQDIKQILEKRLSLSPAKNNTLQEKEADENQGSDAMIKKTLDAIAMSMMRVALSQDNNKYIQPIIQNKPTQTLGLDPKTPQTSHPKSNIADKNIQVLYSNPKLFNTSLDKKQYIQNIHANQSKTYDPTTSPISNATGKGRQPIIQLNTMHTIDLNPKFMKEKLDNKQTLQKNLNLTKKPEQTSGPANKDKKPIKRSNTMQNIDLKPKLMKEKLANKQNFQTNLRKTPDPTSNAVDENRQPIKRLNTAHTLDSKPKVYKEKLTNKDNTHRKPKSTSDPTFDPVDKKGKPIERLNNMQTIDLKPKLTKGKLENKQRLQKNIRKLPDATVDAEDKGSKSIKRVNSTQTSDLKPKLYQEKLANKENIHKKLRKTSAPIFDATADDRKPIKRSKTMQSIDLKPKSNKEKLANKENIRTKLRKTSDAADDERKPIKRSNTTETIDLKPKLYKEKVANKENRHTTSKKTPDSTFDTANEYGNPIKQLKTLQTKGSKPKLYKEKLPNKEDKHTKLRKTPDLISESVDKERIPIKRSNTTQTVDLNPKSNKGIPADKDNSHKKKRKTSASTDDAADEDRKPIKRFNTMQTIDIKPKSNKEKLSDKENLRGKVRKTFDATDESKKQIKRSNTTQNIDFVPKHYKEIVANKENIHSKLNKTPDPTSDAANEDKNHMKRLNTMQAEDLKPKLYKEKLPNKEDIHTKLSNILDLKSDAADKDRTPIERSNTLQTLDLNRKKYKEKLANKENKQKKLREKYFLTSDAANEDRKPVKRSNTMQTIDLKPKLYKDKLANEENVHTKLKKTPDPTSDAVNEDGKPMKRLNTLKTVNLNQKSKKENLASEENTQKKRRKSSAPTSAAADDDRKPIKRSNTMQTLDIKSKLYKDKLANKENIHKKIIKTPDPTSDASNEDRKPMKQLNTLRTKESKPKLYKEKLANKENIDKKFNKTPDAADTASKPTKRLNTMQNIDLYPKPIKQQPAYKENTHTELGKTSDTLSDTADKEKQSIKRLIPRQTIDLDPKSNKEKLSNKQNIHTKLNKTSVPTSEAEGKDRQPINQLNTLQTKDLKPKLKEKLANKQNIHTMLNKSPEPTTDPTADPLFDAADEDSQPIKQFNNLKTKDLKSNLKEKPANKQNVHSKLIKTPDTIKDPTADPTFDAADKDRQPVKQFKTLQTKDLEPTLIKEKPATKQKIHSKLNSPPDPISDAANENGLPVKQLKTMQTSDVKPSGLKPKLSKEKPANKQNINSKLNKIPDPISDAAEKDGQQIKQLDYKDLKPKLIKEKPANKQNIHPNQSSTLDSITDAASRDGQPKKRLNTMNTLDFKPSDSKSKLIKENLTNKQNTHTKLNKKPDLTTDPTADLTLDAAGKDRKPIKQVNTLQTKDLNPKFIKEKLANKKDIPSKPSNTPNPTSDDADKDTMKNLDLKPKLAKEKPDNKQNIPSKLNKTPELITDPTSDAADKDRQPIKQFNTLETKDLIPKLIKQKPANKQNMQNVHARQTSDPKSDSTSDSASDTADKGERYNTQPIIQLNNMQNVDLDKHINKKDMTKKQNMKNLHTKLNKNSDSTIDAADKDRQPIKQFNTMQTVDLKPKSIKEKWANKQIIHTEPTETSERTYYHPKSRSTSRPTRDSTSDSSSDHMSFPKSGSTSDRTPYNAVKGKNISKQKPKVKNIFYKGKDMFAASPEDKKLLPGYKANLLRKNKRRMPRAVIKDKDDDFYKIVKCNDNKPEHTSEIIIGNNIVSLNVVDHEILNVKKFKPTKRISSTPFVTESQNTSSHKNQETSDKPKTRASSVQTPRIFSWNFRYQLSDPHYIANGWTQMPKENLLKEVDIYKMVPLDTETNWFTRNKDRKTILYDTGDKFAEFKTNGNCKIYYKNGNLALKYYNSKDHKYGFRCKIFSEGEKEYLSKKPKPIVLLAVFDYSGNGIVYDDNGPIRLKYNQRHGLILDKKIGHPRRWQWQWRDLGPQLEKNDQEEYWRTKMNNRTSSDPRITQMELNNILRDIEQQKNLRLKSTPYDVKIGPFKINNWFKLSIVDQSKIYLSFTGTTVPVKLNVGMKLLCNEIISRLSVDINDCNTPFEKISRKVDLD